MLLEVNKNLNNKMKSEEMSENNIQKFLTENINLLNEINRLKKTRANSLDISDIHCQEAECLKVEISSVR